ncbi:MAG TPA: peptidoglycan-associated lipoprotein Pal [Albitalea sp.]|nr:peptidoglycan-associated lipoprotein Pal [Albitalea sp.]
MAASLWLVGCSSVDLGEKKPAPVESRTPSKVTPGAGGTGGTSQGQPQSQVANVDLTKGGDAAGGKPSNVIYFDFDSYAVKDEFRPTVEAYAKALVADRKKHLSVEGHTDDRGGREYNLALGQKRAESVVKSLALLGAADNQLEAVSFGKERPAVQGSDEAAWAKNRRAELNYR